MMSTGDYSKLREIEGCESLEDIPSDKDLGHVEKFKEFIGFDHVFVQKDPSKAEMSKTFMAILKLCKKYTSEKKPHMLSYYGGGHGVTNEEQQIITVNSSDPKTALFPIQFKLEYIGKQTDCKVSAFYDCCRVPIMN